MPINWDNPQDLPPKTYKCHFCDFTVGPHRGYHGNIGPHNAFLYVCGNCGAPTYFDLHGAQHPGAVYGDHVKHLPESVQSLYEESRKSFAAKAFTASVLACRKILMHVAVELGAKENETFAYYVQFMADQGYIPPNGRHWVDHIRERANEANHEIVLMTEEQAKIVLQLTQHLLRNSFELPKSIPQPAGQ